MAIRLRSEEPNRDPRARGGPELARELGDTLRLVVDAGRTVEETIEVGLRPGEEPGVCTVYVLSTPTLPPAWYSLSPSTLELSPGAAQKVRLIVHPPHVDLEAPGRRFVITIEATCGTRRLVGRPGSLQINPPAWSTHGKRMLGYLPRVFRDDDFLGRFLLIFQSILDPIEQRIDASDYYLDPTITPPDFLPRLAQWLGVTLGPDMSLPSQRELVRRAGELHRWRGTLWALREEIALRAGVRPLIVENFGGLRLGHDAAMGINTTLGKQCDGRIFVTLVLPGGAGPEQDGRFESLVRALKPPYASHSVRTVAAGRAEG